MRVSRIGIMASLCAMVSLTACKDFAFSGDPLSEADAQDLAEVIVANGFPGTGGVESAPAAAPSTAGAAPAERITININDSGPCDGGGTAAIVGMLEADVNQESRTGTLNYEFTLTPTGCVVTTKGGKTFTITGDPNLQGEGELEWTSTAFSGMFKYEGKFAWTAEDGRAGVCGVNLEAMVSLASGTDASASASLTGSVCGVTVDRQVAIEA